MEQANKTLIILSPGFPADETDSTCLPFPQLFVKTLKQLNPSLNIIVFAFQYPYKTKDYLWHDVNVIPFNGRNKGKISRLLVWKAVWKRLKQVMKENQVMGILNFWLGECALIGKYAAKKYHVKNLTWLLGQDAKKNNRYFSLIKPTAEELIALSDFTADTFYTNYKIKPANIIPPGIDIGAFPLMPPIRKIDIMGAGSLIPLKQYDIFIRVVAELAKKKPGIKTLICGEGRERKHLQEMIDMNKLGKNIELYGELRHEQVLDLMQCSKVFLHPSSYEGFATVVSEALYAGAHVVGFCKPMNNIFKNQHVPVSETEMINNVNEILADINCDHSRVIIYPIEKTCREIMKLYNTSMAAIL